MAANDARASTSQLFKRASGKREKKRKKERKAKPNFLLFAVAAKASRRREGKGSGIPLAISGALLYTDKVN